MGPTLRSEREQLILSAAAIFTPLVTKAFTFTFNSRLNTNVELCQSLKQLLDDADLVTHLDADTRSVFTGVSGKNTLFFFPSTLSETVQCCCWNCAT